MSKNGEDSFLSRYRLIIVFIVYSTLVLDNILLTVVVPIMPVFLHQNVLEQDAKSHKSLAQKEKRPIDTPLRIKSQNLTQINVVKRPSNLNETRTLQKIEINQVVKDIFESSVVGGKERHEKIKNVLGKDPEISESLIHENARVGALFASKAFVQLIINPIVGVATQKVGYQIPFLTGTFILLLSSIIFSIVSNFSWLLIARSLHGVASSCISVCGMGMVARMYEENEEERSKFMGHIMGGIATGVLIGYPLGGFLFQFLNESSPFILISICVVFLLCLQWKHIGEEIAAAKFGKKKQESDEEDDNGESQIKDALMIFYLMKDPYVVIATGSVWFSTSSMALLEPCLPLWLLETIHPKKWQLGTVFLPDSLGYLIGTKYFAVIALKAGRHRMAILAMITLGISAICVPFANSMWQLILPHFGLGLGLGVVDSSLMPLLAKLVEDRHVGAYGSVFAVSQTAVSLAYGLGPLCGGILVENIGFPMVMRGLGVINILYTPLLLYLANACSKDATATTHPMKEIRHGYSEIASE